ncbi:MAG TPA: YraN family protein [Rudaea sp.]|nr:YraN family protein [Rudaea sp.]
MSAAARDLGILWENAASAHLAAAGLEPLARNFTCRYGEIDLVMRTHEGIVFVEVRYRRRAGHGDGIASVGSAKRAKLVRAATMYLESHPQFADLPCRFDVIACSGTPERPRFEWLPNAFDVEN